MKKNLQKILLLSAAVLMFNLTAKATVIGIAVGSNTFSPSNIVISIGDTIHFLWVGGVHTTTSTTIPAGAASWDHPMGSPNNFTFEYVVVVPGTYHYQCTYHASMGMTGVFSTLGTGIDPASIATNLNVAPNPFNDFLKITNVAKNGFTDLTFFDVLGKTILKTKINENTFMIDENTIAFSKLHSGIYFLTLSGISETKTIKLIKQ